MNDESAIVKLCNEAIANARMGYIDSACLIMDSALAKWRQRHFEAQIDSIAPMLKGGS